MSTSSKNFLTSPVSISSSNEVTGVMNSIMRTGSSSKLATPSAKAHRSPSPSPSPNPNGFGTPVPHSVTIILSPPTTRASIQLPAEGSTVSPLSDAATDVITATMKSPLRANSTFQFCRNVQVEVLQKQITDAKLTDTEIKMIEDKLLSLVKSFATDFTRNNYGSLNTLIESFFNRFAKFVDLNKWLPVHEDIKISLQAVVPAQKDEETCHYEKRYFMYPFQILTAADTGIKQAIQEQSSVKSKSCCIVS